MTAPRALPAALLVILALPAGAARADNFVEVAGGIMAPIGDDQWTNYVDSGPKLAARVGGMRQRAGAMLSVDWTPLAANDMGFGNAVDISSHRFRILVSAIAEHRIGDKVSASLRVGGGLDIARVSVHTNIFGITSDNSDTDTGLGVEAAGGLWFDAGTIQIGGELALPISFHDDGADNNIDLESYTSVDFDLMFGVRFLSR